MKNKFLICIIFISTLPSCASAMGSIRMVIDVKSHFSSSEKGIREVRSDRLVYVQQSVAYSKSTIHEGYDLANVPRGWLWDEPAKEVENLIIDFFDQQDLVVLDIGSHINMSERGNHYTLMEYSRSKFLPDDITIMFPIFYFSLKDKRTGWDSSIGEYKNHYDTQEKDVSYKEKIQLNAYSSEARAVWQPTKAATSNIDSDLTYKDPAVFFYDKDGPYMTVRRSDWFSNYSIMKLVNLNPQNEYELYLNVEGIYYENKDQYFPSTPKFTIAHMRRPWIQLKSGLTVDTVFRNYMVMKITNFTPVCSHLSQMYMREKAYVEEKGQYESAFLELLSVIDQSSADQLYEYFYNHQAVIQLAIKDLESKKDLFTSDPILQAQYNTSMRKLKAINILGKYPCLGGYQAGEDVSVLEANFNKCKSQNKIYGTDLTLIAKYIETAKKKKSETMFQFASSVQSAVQTAGQSWEMKQILYFMKDKYSKLQYKTVDGKTLQASCDEVMDSEFINALHGQMN